MNTAQTTPAQSSKLLEAKLPSVNVFRAKLAFLLHICDPENLFDDNVALKRSDWYTKAFKYKVTHTTRIHATSLLPIENFIPALKSENDDFFISELFTKLFDETPVPKKLADHIQRKWKTILIKTKGNLKDEFTTFKARFITEGDNPEKPYYTERLKESFLQTHLDILQNALSYSDDDFKKFKEERLLSETVDGELRTCLVKV